MSPSYSRPSIAVFPFSNLSNDPDQAYFCDGFAEELSIELARFQELAVIGFLVQCFRVQNGSRQVVFTPWSLKQHLTVSATVFPVCVANRSD